MPEEQIEESVQLDAEMESQVDDELGAVEGNEPSEEGSTSEEIDAGASEEESQSSDDESLTDDKAESIDYQAKIRELEERAATEHKRAAGWDTKYRELLAEKKANDARLAELEARIQERQQAETAPVWDSRNPNSRAFMEKVPQIQTALEMLGDISSEEDRQALAVKIRERFGDETLKAYQGFKNHQQTIAQRMAAGDMSLFEDHAKKIMSEMISRRDQEAALERELHNVFSDKENLRIFNEHEDQVQAYIQSGLSAAKAIETVRKEVTLESLKAQLADATAKAAKADAQKKALSGKASLPESRSNQPTSIDIDSIYAKAKELATKRYPTPRPEQIDGIAHDLMEQALANR